MALQGVKACVFDIFGTVVDWQSSVHRQLQDKVKGDESAAELDLLAFTKAWRSGYMRRTREIAGGAPGPTNIDELHRELLDELLDQDEWTQLAKSWTEQDRQEVNLFWHQLDGWPDSSAGFASLRAHKPIVLTGTLSNGSARLLVDIGRHADLAWDLVFSGDILNSFKPNPKMYLGACEKLALKPHEVCMVAAHKQDLDFAASFGLRTCYIPRVTEDLNFDKSTLKSKQDGGDYDIVVSGIDKIVEHL